MDTVRPADRDRGEGRRCNLSFSAGLWGLIRQSGRFLDNTWPGSRVDSDGVCLILGRCGLCAGSVAAGGAGLRYQCGGCLRTKSMCARVHQAARKWASTDLSLRGATCRPRRAVTRQSRVFVEMLLLVDVRLRGSQTIRRRPVMVPTGLLTMTRYARSDFRIGDSLLLDQ